MSDTSVWLSRRCPGCKVESVIDVPLEGYNRWLRGAKVQDALPTLSPDARERVLTGYCPECWEADMGEE